MVVARILDEIVKILRKICPTDADCRGDDKRHLQIEDQAAFLLEDFAEIKLENGHRGDDAEDKHHGIGFNDSK